MKAFEPPPSTPAGTPAAGPRWADFCDVLSLKGYEILGHPAVENVDGRTQTLAFALLARSLSLMAGMQILLKGNRIVEARMLVRACLENEFFLGALKEDPEKFWKELQEDDVMHRQQRGQHYFGSAGDADESVARRLREWLRTSKAEHPKPRAISPKAIAGDNPTYIAYGQLSSDAGHASLTSLKRYVIRGEDSISRFTPHAPVTEEEIVDTYRWVTLSLIRSLGTVNEILGKAEDDGIRGIVQRYSELLGMR